MSYPRAVEYCVVCNASMAELENCINALLEDGWQPLGGLAVLDEPEFFYQAMVKYAE